MDRHKKSASDLQHGQRASAPGDRVKNAGEGRSAILAIIRGRSRGSAIVMAVVFTAIVGSTVSYVMLGSNRQTRNTFRARLMDTSLAASAAIVKSMSQQAYYVAKTRPAQLSGNFSLMDTLITSIKPQGVPGYTAVKNGNDPLIFLQANAGNGEYSKIDNPKDDWNGFTIRRWSYDAVAFVNAADETNTADIDVTAKRLGFEGAGFHSKVEVNYIPLYMYAIFYDNDLEFHPGPKMAVEGPVHSNSTLWLAAGNSLSLNDKVSAAGDLRSYRDFAGKVQDSLLKPVNIKNANNTIWMPESSDHTGTVNIKKRNGSSMGLNNGLPAGLDTNKNTFLDSLDSNWLSSALDRFGGNLTDKAMGNKEIQPPLPFTGEGKDRKQADASELIQRTDKQDSNDLNRARIESVADIRITGDPTKVDKKGQLSDISIEVLKQNEVTGIPEVVATIPNQLKDKKGNPIGDPLVTPGSFKDYRENQTVKTCDLNMGEMAKRTDVQPKIADGNGVIYVSTDNSNSALTAVRVTNAETVPKKAGDNTLTVATDRPMYLEGDVNTGTDRATLLLAADAMYVTSKHLTDATPMNSKAAGPVETNAIFMLGQVSSKYKQVDANGKIIPNGKELDHYEPGYGRYQWSGGVHNVLRYLENWGGVKHTYNGSLICLFESQIAKKRHQTTGDNVYYNAPDRNYNWDAALKDKVPPKGMPVLVEVKISPLERISKAEAVALAE